MSPTKFLTNFLKRFENERITIRETPMQLDYYGYLSSSVPKEDGTFKTPTDETIVGQYEEKILVRCRELTVVPNKTRPGICQAVSSLARHSSKHKVQDYSELIHCFAFNKVLINRELVQSKRNNPGKMGGFTIEAFSDRSFAPEFDEKSVTEMAIYVNLNLVSWLTKNQKRITRSTAAPELVALLVTEDRTDAVKLLTYCYDKSLSHTRMLVDIGMKLIRETLQKNYCSLDYINTLNNIADMFTEALPAGTFITNTKRLINETKDKSQI